VLRSLHIKNGFRHLDSTFNFQKGLTSITGPNESGKSLIMEFFRYSLWGTAALRGASADYKKLEVTSVFDVKGQTYKSYRGKGQARLYQKNGDDWEDLATGTIPVNGAIKTIFGYDMLVFDIANCCLQGKVEELGNMKPADRKKMVDQTIGLQFIDKVIEWTGAEATAAKRSAESLEFACQRVPTPPEPFSMEPPLPPQEQTLPSLAELKQRQMKLRQEQAERQQLEGKLSASLPSEPKAPEDPEVDTEADLLAHEQHRQGLMQTVHNLLVKRDAVQCSPYTKEELERFNQTLIDNAGVLQKRQLLAAGHLTCPSCAHTWPLRADALAKFAHLPDEPTPLPSGVNSSSIIRWEGVLDGPERKAALEKEIVNAQAKLDACPDLSDNLRVRRTYDSALRSYQTLAKNYQDAVRLREAHEQRLATLRPTSDVDREFDDVQATIQAVVEAESKAAAYATALNVYHQQKKAHEALTAKYAADVKAYNEIVEKAAAERQTADGMAAGVVALKDLKVEIKKFLVPSLNKVASHLIFQMTGGKRSSISVDEDFNIQVDGQELSVLSGSGKAVANLAIRIGLGQVLTNKIFPVFMADEFDAAMDAERAEHTAECLANLSKEIGQVILISHKKPEADHHIELR